MRDFSVSASVPASPTAVIDFLADLTRHHGLHPFLVGARVVQEGDEGGEQWRLWEVHERPGMGPLRYPLRFRARLERPDAATLLSRVRLRPGVRLDSVTRAVADGAGGSRVTERTTICAPRPLLPYVAGQAERAHRRVFAALPAVVPGPTPG